jgi:hypothetical protein
MAFDDSEYPVQSTDNAIDKEAILRRIAAQFGITPPAPTTPPLLSLSQQQPAQSRPLLSLSSSPQPDPNASGSLLRPSNPSPAPAPTPARDKLETYLNTPQKTPADFAPKPLHGWAKFASLAVPAAVGFAGGYEKRPELGLQVAEGMQDRRTQAAQQAYQNYEAGQQRQGGLLEKQYEMERQGAQDTLNAGNIASQESERAASAEEKRAAAAKDLAAASQGGKGTYKVMMDPAKPGEPIGVMLHPNGETTDLSGNPVTGLVPFEKEKNKEAKTLQLPNGKQVAGKVDGEGNLLLEDNSPAPKGTKLYQQPNYGMMVLPTKTQSLLDENGIPTDYSWNPQTQKYDIKQGPSAAGAFAHQEAQAGAVSRQADQVIADLQANKKDLGKLSTWVKKYGLGTPIADPKLAGLQAELETFAALQPALHGFRSHSALETFNKIIGGIQNNPDATIAAIRQIQQTAGAINPALNRGGGGAAGPPVGATHIAPGSDGKNHYTDNSGRDLGIAP